MNYAWAVMLRMIAFAAISWGLATASGARPLSVELIAIFALGFTILARQERASPTQEEPTHDQ